ncbi:hypothetical protein RDWZM_001005 [Blomia tropicalis]|uniref:Uncharacterized protein n=1 Tax=Blomia tropicalis TaxID=40697 RepID=A0A9Q0RQB9_BLOTA|nr:hypothetical protein RDWZM_001005 [Blomia tropicalis]
MPTVSSNQSGSLLLTAAAASTTTTTTTTTTSVTNSVGENQCKTESNSITTNNGGNNISTNTSTNSNGPMIDCAGCGSPILDRYYLSAVDRHWHVSCLKCSQCKVDLQSEPSCFSRDGLIFCKADYYRLFTMRRCSRCGEGIYASELVMRVRDHNVYHMQCFTCAWCNSTLSQGDLFGIRDNLVYCRTHFEMLANANLSSSSSSLSTNNTNTAYCNVSTISTVATTTGPNSILSLGSSSLPNSSSIDTATNTTTNSLTLAETCSTLAATPYATNPMSAYSPLSIGPMANTTTTVANNGQSPTTPQSIRKGRPRKRKNVDPQTESMISNNSNSNGQSGQCQHDSMSPTGARTTQSPGVGGPMDGNLLSGLAASIENSCSGNSQLSNSGMSLGHQSGQRTKRMRTSFKHHQLRTMKTYFSVNQNPDAKDLKQLAQKTGLSKRVLQVWFQNARAKWRRNNLKMMPDGTELTLNGQTLLSLGHPSTPSTVIGSPNGSTRPFSSPSPAMSPSGETNAGPLSHQSAMGSALSASSQSLHSQTGIVDAYGHGRDQGLIPMNFQELY